MSQIQSQISAAINAGHWLAGQAATYTPLGGSGVSVNVVIERAEILTGDGSLVVLAAEDRWLLIRCSEYAAEPAAGDQIAVNGETYLVSLIEGKYVWEWADKFNLRRRVYGKRISASVPASD